MTARPNQASAVHGLKCADLVDAMGRLHRHRCHILDLVTPTPGRVLFGPAVTISYFPSCSAALDPGATQDRAEQLGLGLATGDLDWDPVVHLSYPNVNAYASAPGSAGSSGSELSHSVAPPSEGMCALPECPEPRPDLF